MTSLLERFSQGPRKARTTRTQIQGGSSVAAPRPRALQYHYLGEPEGVHHEDVGLDVAISQALI